MGFRSRMSLFALAACATIGAGSTARAGLVVTSVVGGAPTGVNYANFDDLTPGSSSTAVSGGITVSFAPDGKAVQGDSPNFYARPFLSNSNGTLFGDNTASGPDNTTYLTTGLGSVSLGFAGPEMYLGLLWGSVDKYNTLTFYDGASIVGSITGSDVAATANGDQGASGTYYVNINSDVAFNKVVATSSQYAFEFDNVAYNSTPISSPEPSTIISAGIASLMGLGYSCNQRRRSAKVVA